MRLPGDQAQHGWEAKERVLGCGHGYFLVVLSRSDVGWRHMYGQFTPFYWPFAMPGGVDDVQGQ